LALSAKVFRLKEYLPLDIIADKIKGFKKVVELDGVEIHQYFDDIKLLGDVLKAYFIFDEPKDLNIGGELRRLAIRREALVSFKEETGEVILIVFEKKFRANRIANLISEILYARAGYIVEARISHETLKNIHESSPESTKVIYFDNVDIPNVDKLALYGDALADSSLYNNYLEHGLIWYVVFQHGESGYIVGITRNLIIAMFSKVTLDEFHDFVLRHILPLLYV
jgi:hypothetical protein